ncbi:hypothetical protein BASA50_000392 [Batrachochytrium salamandrivorans]|uniref:Uncharacterized protein n=1 Tax=Batrachochytrium salamandrivorans TaxID=1357716 RepID=A0ABQ8ETQ1_9FUNG|nr:hypothetical protein BASA50_000392 [Batrachochytrium salamandrivorans]
MRRDVYVELQLLKDSHALIAKHNADLGTQLRLSPNSCYNINILKKQYAKILKKIDESLVKQEKISEAMRVSSDDVLKAKSVQLENHLRIFQSYNGAARRILWKHKYNKPLNAWVSEFLSTYLWNAEI